VQRWEYKVRRKSFALNPTWLESFCNALGSNGWELLDILAGPMDVMLIFKRPVEATVSQDFEDDALAGGDA
jgi:hypothetical protein